MVACGWCDDDRGRDNFIFYIYIYQIITLSKYHCHNTDYNGIFASNDRQATFTQNKEAKDNKSPMNRF